MHNIYIKRDTAEARGGPPRRPAAGRRLRAGAEGPALGNIKIIHYYDYC